MTNIDNLTGGRLVNIIKLLQKLQKWIISKNDKLKIKAVK